ncbi:MAG: TraR/DksA C4-type zinc finger protein [Acidimicrobiia bacterium]
MARKLAKSTVAKYKKKLAEEEDRLEALIEGLEAEREEVRLSEAASDRSPDPNTAEGGSLAFELEKELSIAQNAEDLLAKVRHAQDRIRRRQFGVCEHCGADIPTERLDVLPYATTCVTCAASR